MVNASRGRHNANTQAANPEHCKTDGDCGRKNTESLGRVMMMVMDKDEKKDSELGLTRLDQWSELAELPVHDDRFDAERSQTA
ncbi:hypothetical protein K469DRAFT_50046 [Zopfia rhizophila CBS 207.26]|uniref:Uncharacterized protein n=1 Tax=Zopfia rhizophila CBS 207.26 TaxID=1314779 RepID=A0A6A6ED25_9PEZI|nr:hypothetical protein K469DRAFT_50046 [Zopfia rhizophila CBS 207.26]